VPKIKTRSIESKYTTWSSYLMMPVSVIRHRRAACKHLPDEIVTGLAEPFSLLQLVH